MTLIQLLLFLIFPFIILTDYIEAKKNISKKKISKKKNFRVKKEKKGRSRKAGKRSSKSSRAGKGSSVSSFPISPFASMDLKRLKELKEELEFSIYSLNDKKEELKQEYKDIYTELEKAELDEYIKELSPAIQIYFKDPVKLVEEVYEYLETKKMDDKSKTIILKKALLYVIPIIILNKKYTISEEMNASTIEKYNILKDIHALYKWGKDNELFINTLNQIKEKINPISALISDTNFMSDLHFDRIYNYVLSAELSIVQEYIKKKKLIPDVTKIKELEDLKKNNQKIYEDTLNNINITIDYDPCDEEKNFSSDKTQLLKVKEVLFSYSNHLNEIQLYVDNQLNKKVTEVLIQRILEIYREFIIIYTNSEKEFFVNNIPTQGCIGQRGDILNRLALEYGKKNSQDITFESAINRILSESLHFENYILYLLNNKNNIISSKEKNISFKDITSEEYKNKIIDELYTIIIQKIQEENGEFIVGNFYKPLFEIYKKKDENKTYYLFLNEYYYKKPLYMFSKLKREFELGNLQNPNPEETKDIKENLSFIVQNIANQRTFHKQTEILDKIITAEDFIGDIINPAFKTLKQDWPYFFNADSSIFEDIPKDDIIQILDDLSYYLYVVLKRQCINGFKRETSKFIIDKNKDNEYFIKIKEPILEFHAIETLMSSGKKVKDNTFIIGNIEDKTKNEAVKENIRKMLEDLYYCLQIT